LQQLRLVKKYGEGSSEVRFLDPNSSNWKNTTIWKKHAIWNSILGSALQSLNVNYGQSL